MDKRENVEELDKVWKEAAETKTPFTVYEKAEEFQKAAANYERLLMELRNYARQMLAQKGGQNG